MSKHTYTSRKNLTNEYIQHSLQQSIKTEERKIKIHVKVEIMELPERKKINTEKRNKPYICSMQRT